MKTLKKLLEERLKDVDPGWIISVSLIVVMIFVIVPWAINLAENSNGAELTPTTIITENTFNGTLGMVTYGHSWFGLGGADSSTLSFQNSTSIISFHFNKDLAVTIGQKYEVQYKQTVTTYFNVTKDDFNSWYGSLYKNSTDISPESVIWISDP
jgi:hypothetical protein